MRRYRIAAGLLLGSTLLSWYLVQSDAVRYEVRLNELPMTLGPWEGRTEALTRADLVHAVLETSAVLSRTYVTRDGRGDRIDLLITYFERGHRGFHPPEVSFVASGHTIVRADRVGIPLTEDANGPRLDANRFVGTTPTGEVLFLYWFGIGDDVMASYYRASVVRLWDAMRRRPRPASMVRLALPVVGGDLAADDGARPVSSLDGWCRSSPRYLIERPRTTPTRTAG